MRLTLSLLLAGLATQGAAASSEGQQLWRCGGSFSDYVMALPGEVRKHGVSPDLARAFLSGAQQDQAVLRADRRKGIFLDPFVTFSRKLISQNRMDRGRSMSERYDWVFDQIEAQYGISRGVLLAFWAFETDFGAVQGDFNTRDALVTLSHDCRRPEIFQPQVLAAMKMYGQGDLVPHETTGAWAGEIGMVQMLPKDILEHGVDGDGDGHVSLKTSAPDALLSAARMLSSLGWRHGEPWLQEITLPADFDWSLAGLQEKRSIRQWERLGVRGRSAALASGLEASVILPQGRFGPAFIAYPNFDVYFEWNQSFTYVLTAAYFGTRLMGAPVYDAGTPEPGLETEDMRSLQRRLTALGYDVGEADGILGAGTRAAVRDVQKRIGWPADAWPTPALLSRL